MKKNNKMSAEEFEHLASIYKLFSSASRLKILHRLSAGECIASELADMAQISPSAASHQLKELKQSRIVKSRKDGMNVFYSLSDNHIAELLHSGIEHMKGENCYES